MDQFANELRPFLGSAVEFDPAAVAKHLAKPEITPAFDALPAVLEAATPFDSATLEPTMRGLAESRGVLSGSARAFLFIGLLGGFTTFSSFGYETFQLLRLGQGTMAVVSIGLQVVLGLAAMWGGHALGAMGRWG